MAHQWMELEIASKEMEATDIVSLVLVDPEGAPLPPFSAGSHVDLEIKDGLIRQYSLCNAPLEHDRYEIAVLRDPDSRGGSIAVHEKLHVGQRVRISEPRNLFPLEPSEDKAFLLAGGIGVTPLLCMAERLDHLKAPFELHYCTRSKDRTAFYDRIKQSSYADNVAFHFDDGDSAQRFKPAEIFTRADADSHVYVCGPGGFIDWVFSAAKEAGFPLERLHREYFSVSDDASKGEDGAFEVQIASTGEVLQVPADRSVVEVLHEHGVDITVSCEQGVCGTCITRVLEGQPDHRDMLALDGDEEFAPCCSRSLSPRLVLDL